MEMNIDITASTIIADLVQAHPECIEVLDRHSMPCMTCMGASGDTVAEGAMMHDLDIELIIAELRECCLRVESGNSSA